MVLSSYLLLANQYFIVIIDCQNNILLWGNKGVVIYVHVNLEVPVFQF